MNELSASLFSFCNVHFALVAALSLVFLSLGELEWIQFSVLGWCLSADFGVNDRPSHAVVPRCKLVWPSVSGASAHRLAFNAHCGVVGTLMPKSVVRWLVSVGCW